MCVHLLIFVAAGCVHFAPCWTILTVAGRDWVPNNGEKFLRAPQIYNNIEWFV